MFVTFYGWGNGGSVEVKQQSRGAQLVSQNLNTVLCLHALYRHVLTSGKGGHTPSLFCSMSGCGSEAFSCTSVLPGWKEGLLPFTSKVDLVLGFVFGFHAHGLRSYIIPTHGTMGENLQMKSLKSYLWKYRSIPITVDSKSHIKYCLKYVGCQPKLERIFVIQISLL